MRRLDSCMVKAFVIMGELFVGEILVKDKDLAFKKKRCEWVGDKGHKRNVHGVSVI